MDLRRGEVGTEGSGGIAGLDKITPGGGEEHLEAIQLDARDELGDFFDGEMTEGAGEAGVVEEAEIAWGEEGRREGGGSLRMTMASIPWRPEKTTPSPHPSLLPPFLPPSPPTPKLT